MKSQFVKLNLKAGKTTTLRTTPLVFEKKSLVKAISLDSENKSLVNTTPFVFEKKKNKSVIKTLKYISSDTGKTRHYPGAAIEWYNSIYTFNKNYLKSLPALDKTLGVLLKHYCNMWPISIKRTAKKKMHIIKREMDIIGLRRGKAKYWFKRANNIRPIQLHKRLSPKKVFVGKGDLKHTNNKVIVTLYTYNVQKFHLFRKIKRLINSFFLTELPLIRFMTTVEDKNKDTTIQIYKKKGMKKDRKHNMKLYAHNSKWIVEAEKEEIKYKKVFLFNRRLTLDEYLKSSYNYIRSFIENPYNHISDSNKTEKHIPLKFLDRAVNRSKTKDPLNLDLTSSYINLLSYVTLNVSCITKDLKNIINFYELLTKLVEWKILNENQKMSYFIKYTNKFNVFKYRNTPRFIFTKFKEKKLVLASLLRFAWILYINDIKFKHPVLVSKLKYLVQNLYGKEVEFNIVDLKKMHLSSDIYTQAVALKLKNRNNKLYRVLKSSLRKVNLPNVSRLSERYSEFNRNEYLANIIRNTYINSMFDNKSTKIDSLNNLLLGLFPSVSSLNLNIRKRSSTIKRPTTLINYVIKTLKHLKLAGIRVEAKGRLTRRFTAQRSVFKMRYKGGLKNVDSSFKGLPAIMLRGFVKTNVQYSFISSKNRNGAYGVKGWVGNK